MSVTSQHNDPDVIQLIAAARSELGIRRARLAAFGPSWVGDVWWDILLVLFTERSGGIDPWTLAGRTGQSFAVTDRWLEILRVEGFVQCCPATSDMEVRLFEISFCGGTKVEQCLLGNSIYGP